MTRTLFLGLSKVFDSVDHKMLFQKFFYYKEEHLYNFLLSTWRTELNAFLK